MPPLVLQLKQERLLSRWDLVQCLERLLPLRPPSLKEHAQKQNSPERKLVVAQCSEGGVSAVISEVVVVVVARLQEAKVHCYNRIRRRRCR